MKQGARAGICCASLLMLLLLLLQGCKADGGSHGEQLDDQTMLDLARQVGDTWIQSVRPEQNDWSWGDGVLMFGFSQLAARTGLPRYWNYMQEWMDHHIDQGYYVAFSDNCPPGIAAVRLFERTGEDRYQDVMERIWYYLQHVAVRTSDGGLNHMGFVTGKQLWVDSLFMFGTVLNEMSRLEQTPVYQDELIDQIRIFASHLRDGEVGGTGLFRHMWDDRTKKVTPEELTFWARGNAWVFTTLVELLSAMPKGDPRGDEPLAILTRMAETLAAYQDASGLWHTVLRDRDTYLETSASALYAFAFHKGMRTGILGEEYEDVVRKAMDGVQTRLFRGCEGGVIVTGTSHGTSPGDRDYYAAVSTGDQVPYGVGAVLLATVEVGAWPATWAFAQRQGCPDLPSDPKSPEDFLARAVYRLETADLEGAQSDFRRVSALAPQKGEGPFGDAFIDILFTAFRIYDAFTRFTINELDFSDFQEVIRSEVLPILDEIKEKITVAQQDETLSLSIPVLQINRRGMYTPLKDLYFDSPSAGAVLVLLALIETVLRLIA